MMNPLLFFGLRDLLCFTEKNDEFKESWQMSEFYYQVNRRRNFVVLTCAKQKNCGLEDSKV